MLALPSPGPAARHGIGWFDSLLDNSGVTPYANQNPAGKK
jgi:hypothetical protein